MKTTLPATLNETHFSLPGQTSYYKGKVRDVYTIGSDLLIMVATDRISAFDVVLPRAIPHKGQVLNQLASHFLKATADIVPNWLLAVPDPNVSAGRRCEPLKVEMVIRGYLTGHAWREYRSGKRSICGVPLPEGLREHDQLPEPVITPTTKAAEGHDEDISKEEIIRTGLVETQVYEKLEEFTHKLYQRGTEMAASQGLILVDTKYEFGMYNNEVYLIDEVHTPDSSRYFYSDTYQTLQDRGEQQRQLSKEFVRQWLISEGFQGRPNEPVPEMDDERLMLISNRYIELFEKVSGMKFIPESSPDVIGRVEKAILNWLEHRK